MKIKYFSLENLLDKYFLIALLTNSITISTKYCIHVFVYICGHLDLNVILHIRIFVVSKINLCGRRDGSAVKNMYWSCRDPSTLTASMLSSLPVTLAIGNPTPYSGSFGINTYITNSHTDINII